MLLKILNQNKGYNKMKNKFLSVFHTWMYVSSCKSVDMRIGIVKNEEDGES